MHGLLSTPLIKITATKRKPAINSKAQEVTKDLFSSAIEKKMLKCNCNKHPPKQQQK